MKILHISDVHFGMGDRSAEQPRITEALIEAVHADGTIPDICIFSGDLADKGETAQFESGEAWLRRLVRDEWNAALVVVPGNHDVDRQGTRPNLFRAIAGDAGVFHDWTRAKTVNCDHLIPFFKWYEKAKTRLPLCGDWNSPFGLHHCNTEYKIPVHVIGLNSALFCCDNSDEKNLIIDPKVLNTYLGLAAKQKGLVIAVAHHPLDFLVPWNREQIEQILAQEEGAHLFLHGHLHAAAARARTDSTGSGLTTLAGGAAYQGSKWPQYFAFYTLDFDKREVTASVYNYSQNSGKWLKDASKSRPIVTNLPIVPGGLIRIPRDKTPVSAQSVQPEPAAAPASPSISESTVKEPASHAAALRAPDLPTPPGVTPNERAFMLRDAALEVQGRLLRFFSNFEIRPPEDRDGQQFALKSRVKTVKRILEKYEERKSKDPDYKIESMPDICGFRIITKYQDEIPLVISKLLESIEERVNSPFHHERIINIDINNSRTESDPLSLVEPVRAVCAQSKLKPAVSVETKSSGYSSIHFVGSVAIRVPDHPVREMRVEIQIRSALEDIWGEIDHELGYVLRRRNIRNSRSRHLLVLKNMIDAFISYVDVIKREGEIEIPEIVTSKSVNDPDDQLRRLKDLPEAIYSRVDQAFQIWKKAYKGIESNNVDIADSQEGAKAFENLLTDFRDQPTHNRALAKEFTYICRVEYAYLLQYTGEPADSSRAEDVYVNILDDRPNDATANFRLGALLRKKGDIEKLNGALELSKASFLKSRTHLTQALDFINRGTDERIKKNHRVYDVVRREVGLVQWRICGIEDLPMPERRDALLAAIKAAHEVILNPAHDDPVMRRNAINDFLYYRCWESTQLEGAETSYKISETDLASYREELYAAYAAEPEGKKTYNIVDTLLRVFQKDDEKARQLALSLEDILENVARKRKPTLLKLEKGTMRWYNSLIKELDLDESDALSFAHDILQRHGRHNVLTNKE